MKLLLSAFGCGALFGLGLAISGMGQPQKIMGFLDIFGAFDPTLIARRFKAPLLVPAFPTYEFTRVDRRLVIGSLVFGIGWGMVGFCPAPGIISAGFGTREGLLFVPSMLAGMAIFHGMETLRSLALTDETGAPAPSAAK